MLYRMEILLSWQFPPRNAIATQVCCLASGALIDRGVPLQLLFALGVLLHGVVALAATRLSTAAGGLVYAITRGLGGGCVAPVIGCAIPRFFGTRGLGRLLGGQALMFVGGTCLGTMLLGGSAELLGSMNPMLVAMSVPAAVLTLLLLTLRQPRAS